MPPPPMTRLLLARPLPQAASGRPAVLRDQLLPTGAPGASAARPDRQPREAGTACRLAGRAQRRQPWPALAPRPAAGRIAPGSPARRITLAAHRRADPA